MKLQYAVVYERAPNNYGAYVPELPGCVSTGDSWDEIRENIKEAISFHIEGLMLDDDSIPKPSMSIGDAMAFHSRVLAESALKATEMETMFGLVEVEVILPQTMGAS